MYQERVLRYQVLRRKANVRKELGRLDFEKTSSKTCIKKCRSYRNLRQGWELRKDCSVLRFQCCVSGDLGQDVGALRNDGNPGRLSVLRQRGRHRGFHAGGRLDE